MANSALDALPPASREWIIKNVKRGCPLDGLVESLSVEMGHSLPLARAAIAEASHGALTQARSTRENMPHIALGANALRNGDREITILVAVQHPHIVLLGNVLSGQECDDLVELARPGFVPSRQTELERERNIVRSSLRADILRHENTWLSALAERLADLTHWPAERFECFQLQHYLPGNEFQPHHDYFDFEFAGERIESGSCGQRLATLILYLSDVDAGGSTVFPGLGLEIRPKKGNALFFLNTDPQHVPDRATLHGGSPVVRGTKVIANVWLRERFFR